MDMGVCVYDSPKRKNLERFEIRCKDKNKWINMCVFDDLVFGFDYTRFGGFGFWLLALRSYHLDSLMYGLVLCFVVHVVAWRDGRLYSTYS